MSSITCITPRQQLLRQQRLPNPDRLPGPGGTADKFYRCDVIFGMPSADCGGTGICKIVVNQRPEEAPAGTRNCRRTSAVFTRNSQSGELSLLLFPALLCPELFRKHLRKGVLRLYEACTLPLSLTAYLGIPTGCLAAGAYAIETHSGYYKIRFNPQAAA